MKIPNIQQLKKSPYPIPCGRQEGATDGATQDDIDDFGGSQREMSKDMVRQPAKIMRIGSMIKQLLEEVRVAPLDEASRTRLKEVHHNCVVELEDGLSPELTEELERLSLPFADETVPTEAELRIAQAQLVGWLEGLFHGIQAALAAQHMATQEQLEQIRRALPPADGAPSDDQTEARRGSSRSGPYL
ncbi:bacterial proteasome activator family protein [Streptomyces chartreusis]|uniref:bacterial proteasome activator family protein n=1 Tax=Streptomyces chartreusis TaxID=1969 RepID=UPI00368CA4FE